MKEDVVTNPLVNIPTAVLSPLGSIRHSLVCFEVPVQMTRLLLFAFFRFKKSTTACSTSVRPGLIETGYQSLARAIVGFHFISVLYKYCCYWR